MPAFYRATVADFLTLSESELVGRLSVAYAQGGFQHQHTSQTITWTSDILRLRASLAHLATGSAVIEAWTVLLEFPIPRKEKRIDVVLLAGDSIVLLELKSGKPGLEAFRQLEEYALLLHYFHQPSTRRKILGWVVSEDAGTAEREMQAFLPLLEAPAYWIPPIRSASWTQLSNSLQELVYKSAHHPIDPETWDEGEYRPVPTIIDAARSLRGGLDTVREIAHSRAARHDVDRLTEFVSGIISTAQSERKHVICFVTGVPGSGKTLVGLNLAFRTKAGDEAIHFMSGTGPLVKVLQAVLANDYQEQTKERAHIARIYAKTLIENVHVFASEYAGKKANIPPSNHVIIFDEAQRAWDRAQNFAKFKRPYSEPEMLLDIMSRHSDWAVVIALVGGGQEINSGEAGLHEWGDAILASKRQWSVFASPQALTGGATVAGSQLISSEDRERLNPCSEDRLHLDVSVRSLGADSYARWVNHVVRGEAQLAAAVKAQDTFPILLTRSLQQARQLLRENTRGDSRSGLVASSQAARLRAEGLEPDSNFHRSFPWHHWYLAGRSDVRSSHQLEVFATEFEIQGLELDWIGLCWGGDFVFDAQNSQWKIRKLWPGKTSKWIAIRDEKQRDYRRNSYRVLLTRPRQGIVLFVPKGDPADPTRSTAEFEETAQFLLASGARYAEHADTPPPITLEEG